MYVYDSVAAIKSMRDPVSWSCRVCDFKILCKLTVSISMTVVIVLLNERKSMIFVVDKFEFYVWIRYVQFMKK